jgi:hypothetical protein
MRALLLIAAGSLALVACGRNDTTANAVGADQNLTADDITANDTTAIDAATGDDANMAADSSAMLANDANLDANDADNSADNASDNSANTAGNHESANTAT